MDALILLVPLSLVAVGVAVALFFRMSASGQFDDVEGPARSVLMDDDRPRARSRAQPRGRAPTPADTPSAVVPPRHDARDAGDRTRSDKD